VVSAERVACHPPVVRHPRRAITLEIPAAWEDRSILSFVGPEERGFRPNVLIGRRPLRGASFDQIVDEQSEALHKQLSRVQRHGSRDSEIGGMSARWIDFSFHSKEAGALRQLLAFIAAGDEMLTASVTASAQQMEDRRAEYAAMIESLVLSG
jgi:hypothetical protein